jgi:hypothetical protein
MRFYPDLFGPRLGWLTIDLLMSVWIATWIAVGRAVDRLILRLDALAQGLIGAGRTFNSWLNSFEQAVPTNVPVLTDFVRHQLELLRQHSGDSLISLGQAGSHAIHWLALVLSVLVAALPVSLAFLVYLPPRIRLLYDIRGVHRTVRRALSRPELTPQVLEVLAGRALYTLPYHQLLRYSRNPVEDWCARRFESLARAELERYGLTVERYFDQLAA